MQDRRRRMEESEENLTLHKEVIFTKKRQAKYKKRCTTIYKIPRICISRKISLSQKFNLIKFWSFVFSLSLLKPKLFGFKQNNKHPRPWSINILSTCHHEVYMIFLDLLFLNFFKFISFWREERNKLSNNHFYKKNMH